MWNLVHRSQNMWISRDAACRACCEFSKSEIWSRLLDASDIECRSPLLSNFLLRYRHVNLYPIVYSVLCRIELRTLRRFLEPRTRTYSNSELRTPHTGWHITHHTSHTQLHTSHTQLHTSLHSSSGFWGEPEHGIRVYGYTGIWANGHTGYCITQGLYYRFSYYT